MLQSIWKRRFLSCAIASVFAIGQASFATELTVVGYNVESGGAQAAVVAERIAAIDGCDLWGFSEVQNESWARTFEEAAAVGEGDNADFDYLLGSTGGADKLAIVYDRNRFELIEQFEVNEINVGGRVRAPLVARLRDGHSGQEFFFMVNHLYRSKASQRRLQATLLNRWAQSQALPIIAVGDYNFDWSVPNGDADHDEGFDELVGGDVFAWIRPPEPLVRSQCSTQYNSVLDFVFVAGAAQAWNGVSEIVVAEGDCPDDNTTSDHRPVRATFDIPLPSTTQPSNSTRPSSSSQPTTSSADVRQALLDRIQRLEAELAELRRLVEQLPDG
ncbi:MAG: endonuclease/exonuclease/phosphatase family protein [Planctomycetota bacterium]